MRKRVFNWKNNSLRLILSNFILTFRLKLTLMSKILPLLIACLLPVVVFCQADKAISIIPVPVTIKKTSGYFVLPAQVTISGAQNTNLKQVSSPLSDRLSTAAGIAVSVSTNATSATIQFVLNTNTDAQLGTEGYQLSVTPQNIVLKANKPAGLFYGVQSLLQLMPKEIEKKTVAKNVTWQVPCVEITDYPRFGWRGLMFDVSRHFFTKDEVKQYIDDMVQYKFNLLHLHLTDDEGWRIEIKSLPNLTKVGAWNVQRTGTFGDFSKPTPDEPRTYGGFYTQEDIKELVQYAAERFVNILPEIDVPGHSLAAIAAYPELSCTTGADKYVVRSGEKIMDWHTGGFTALVDNTLCPANEKVYAFLDKVVTEVAQLFPFEYIHMGGDECAKNFWEKSTAVKALMKKEKLKSMHEVQSYFEKRLEKIVTSKGKKFMGWDEILEGGLAPGAAVMSWRGMKGGIEAAKLGHEVVMTPTDFAYIDYMQGDPAIEPSVYATLLLRKAYQFEPLPDGVDPKLILGGQANLWTEQVYNMRHAQYMTWPRGLATAESLWSPKSNKDWNSFEQRVENEFERRDIADRKYAPSIFDPMITPSMADTGKLKIELSTEAPDMDIYYSFDNSFPDRFYPKYTQPLIAPQDASTLKIITYRGEEVKGRLVVASIADLKKRARKK